MRISEMARLTGYEFCGEDREIQSVQYAWAAEEDSLAILEKESGIKQTRAGCILTKPRLFQTDKTLLFSCEPLELAAIKIAKILVDHQVIPSDEVLEYTKEQEFYRGRNVVIGKGTVISPNVYIGNQVKIGDNCYIEPNVFIGSRTIIQNNVHIATGSSIGANSFYHYFEDGLKEFPGIGVVRVGQDVSIGCNTTIQRGTFSDTCIGQGCMIGNLVDIGHDVCMGANCKIVSQSGIASMVRIGDSVQIYGQAGIANGVSIGDRAVVMAKSLVTKNVASGQRVSGIHAREHGEELRILAKIQK